jgi:hypothetical protein
MKCVLPSLKLTNIKKEVVGDEDDSSEEEDDDCEEESRQESEYEEILNEPTVEEQPVQENEQAAEQSIQVSNSSQRILNNDIQYNVHAN